MIRLISGWESPKALRVTTAWARHQRMEAKVSAAVGGGGGVGTALVSENDTMGQVEMTSLRERCATFKLARDPAGGWLAAPGAFV